MFSIILLVPIIVPYYESQEEGVVSFPDTTFHGLFDGDQVIFTGVRGMTELNHCPPREVKVEVHFLALYIYFYAL